MALCRRKNIFYACDFFYDQLRQYAPIYALEGQSLR